MDVFLKGRHVFVHSVEKNYGEYVIKLDRTHSGDALVRGPHLGEFVTNRCFIGEFEL